MADHQHTDLGDQNQGSVVVITFDGEQANIRLLDDDNLDGFLSAQRHTFYGGLASQSPVRLRVPGDGHWHLVVEGPDASVEVEPEGSATALEPTEWVPPRPKTPLDIIADDIAAVAPEAPDQPKPYDVVIVHAFRDKLRVVSELAKAMRVGHKLEVGVDQFTLRDGDDVRKKLDAGLVAGRFGVLMLTPNFFAMSWSGDQLNAMVTFGAFGERQVLLPVWHAIKAKEAAKHSRVLAEKTGIWTADTSMPEIAAKIAQTVRGSPALDV